MIETPARPMCRYYGGKWKLADWVISHFPNHRCYVEAFGGAGSILLKKKPARIEIYNDLSDEMVNLFTVVRDIKMCKELQRMLLLTPYSRTEWLNCYALSDDQIEQARRTIVLATMSHNPSKVLSRKSNGFRSCSSGHHRLPQDFIGVSNNLDTIMKRLKGVIIENREAVKLIKQHDGLETLHYVDPPYMGELRSDKRSTYQHELFTEEDHRKLSSTLLNLKGYVVLSGYRCDQYKTWYEGNGWSPFYKKATTGAAKKGKSTRIEVLWLNPKATRAQHQQKLF